LHDAAAVAVRIPAEATGSVGVHGVLRLRNDFADSEIATPLRMTMHVSKPVRDEGATPEHTDHATRRSE